MVKKLGLTQNEKDLTRRYLIWCYKTTREELDKVDRYFTQQQVDDVVLQQLKGTKEYKASAGNVAYKNLVDGFQVYMGKKQANALRKKFKDKKHTALNPDYQYLHNRFIAIEKAIRYFLGSNALKEIHFLYEQEMTARILQAREHT